MVDGRSYVSLVLSSTADARPGVSDQQVWLIGLGDEGYAARCDDGRPGPITRSDPEVLVAPEQVFVDYYTLDGGMSVAYRCAADLGASAIETRSVAASRTDPAIADLLGEHLVAVEAPGDCIGRLALLLPLRRQCRRRGRRQRRHRGGRRPRRGSGW